MLPQALYPNDSEVRVRGVGRSDGVRQAVRSANGVVAEASADNAGIIGKHCFSFLNGEIEAPFKKR